jgi:hypothetical protein
MDDASFLPDEQETSAIEYITPPERTNRKDFFIVLGIVLQICKKTAEKVQIPPSQVSRK